MKYCIVNCTVPTKESGLKIAEELVKRRLAACCNIIPNVSSVYFWNGELHNDEEYLLVIKTRLDLFKRVKTEIKKLHSYETPEIVAVPVEKVNDDYAEWMDSQLSV